MAVEINPEPGSLQAVCYQVRVAGELDAEWSEWFTGLRVVAAGGETLLVGPMDQATLYGVLKRVRDLGLRLVSVIRSEDS
ncbi:MAG: hypothetical protein WAL50_20350 [Kineosporiaceae bacterium]